jgi:hypothetical protein
MLDMANGNGSGLQFHIYAWVAVVPDKDWSLFPTATDWTGKVLQLVARRADWTGCFGPGCPPPGQGNGATPLAIILYK